MNVLLDTNVLLSAALRDRLPEQVVRYVTGEDACRWIVTAEIVREYVEVLKRPKFGLTPDTLRDWANLIEMRTVVVPSPPADVSYPRDPKDAIFLSAAVSAGADFLITGDRDVLSCRGTVSTRVVTVVEFAAEFNIA